MGDIFVTKVYADMTATPIFGHLSGDLRFYGILDVLIILAIILTVTVFLEYAAFLILNRSLNRKLILKTVVIMNLISNPLINLLYYVLLKLSITTNTLWQILALEVTAIVIETFIINKFMSLGFKKAVIYSLILNTTSFLIGSLVSNFGFTFYDGIKSLIFGAHKFVGPENIEMITVY